MGKGKEDRHQEQKQDGNTRRSPLGLQSQQELLQMLSLNDEHSRPNQDAIGQMGRPTALPSRQQTHYWLLQNQEQDGEQDPAREHQG